MLSYMGVFTLFPVFSHKKTLTSPNIPFQKNHFTMPKARPKLFSKNFFSKKAKDIVRALSIVLKWQHGRNFFCHSQLLCSESYSSCARTSKSTVLRDSPKALSTHVTTVGVEPETG